MKTVSTYSAGICEMQIIVPASSLALFAKDESGRSLCSFDLRPRTPPSRVDVICAVYLLTGQLAFALHAVIRISLSRSVARYECCAV